MIRLEQGPDGIDRLVVPYAGGRLTMRRDGDLVRCVAWADAGPDSSGGAYGHPFAIPATEIADVVTVLQQLVGGGTAT